MTSPAINPARKRLLLIASGVFLMLALAYGLWWVLFGAHFESTDDAYVHGNLVQITPRCRAQ
ncbi:multidrug resistance protein A [Bordetella trematum]|nr:multidrug resistance protein A [Bordetella trematum]